MTSQKLRKIGIRNAILFILIGSLIFGAYYYTSNNLILYLEYVFIFIAGAFSFIMLLRIFNHVTKHRRSRTSLLVTAGFIAISVIATFYFFRKITALQDTMRITFVNKTGTELSEIKVIGCEKKYIDNIQPDKSETVWINITRICSITISYKENGVPKNKEVSAFINPSEGRKLTYAIN
jgi:hypothetical protein